MADLQFGEEQLAAMDKGCGKMICHGFDPETQTMMLARGVCSARVRFNGRGARALLPVSMAGQRRGLWGPYLPYGTALRRARRALMAAAA